MDRYKRQILFDKIGKEGQIKISNSSIAIVGVGALGSVSAELFTRAGVKKLIIFDKDKVELSNLQRQSLYTEEDVGISKVFALKKHLKKINSNIEIISVDENINVNNISKIDTDIIVDGTDNLETRFLINKYAKERKLVFIYGAAAGSISVVYTVTTNSPCLECVFGKSKNFMTCENLGIIAPTTHIVASIQVSEAVKLIVDKDNYESKIIRFDIWKNSFDIIKVKKSESCVICNKKLLDGKSDLIKSETEFIIKECTTKSSFSAKPVKKISFDFKKLKNEFEVLEDAGIILILKVDGEELIVHNHGEIVFKKLKDTEKMRIIAKKIYSFSK